MFIDQRRHIFSPWSSQTTQLNIAIWINLFKLLRTFDTEAALKAHLGNSVLRDNIPIFRNREHSSKSVLQ